MTPRKVNRFPFCFSLRVHKSTALRVSYRTPLEHQNTLSYDTANKHVCVFLRDQFFGRSAPKHTGQRVGPERAVEAVNPKNSVSQLEEETGQYLHHPGFAWTCF